MPFFLHWTAHASPPGTPSNTQVRDGLLSNNTPATGSGVEGPLDASAGSRDIDEVTALAGLPAGTAYTIEAVVFDDAAPTVFYRAPVGTITTSAAASTISAAGVAAAQAVGVAIAASTITAAAAATAQATGAARVAAPGVSAGLSTVQAAGRTTAASVAASVAAATAQASSGAAGGGAAIATAQATAQATGAAVFASVAAAAVAATAQAVGRTTAASVAAGAAAATAQAVGAFLSSITRPTSDVTATGWTASSGSDLFDMLDEAVASDTDFITSPVIDGSQGPAIFGLGSTLAAGTYDIRIRARRTDAAGDIRLLLLDGSNATQGTSSWQSLTGSFAPYTLSVTTTGSAVRARLEVQ